MEGHIPKPLHQVWKSYASVLELRVTSSYISHRIYHWECVCRQCECRITWSMLREADFPTYLKSLTPLAYSLYNLYGSRIETNWVTCQNSVWPCVTDHIGLCVCAKLHQHWMFVKPSCVKCSYLKKYGARVYKKPLSTDKGFAKCIRPLSGKSRSTYMCGHGIESRAIDSPTFKSSAG